MKRLVASLAVGWLLLPALALGKTTPSSAELVTRRELIQQAPQAVQAGCSAIALELATRASSL